MNVLLIVLPMIILGLLIKSILFLQLKIEQNIENNGIEVNAIVTKVTKANRIYTSYVTYIGDDNIEHEARIINLSKNYPYGEKLRIKFLPGKYRYCIVVLN